ncbi:MAG: sulfatase-like hydrolase/transferase [Solobacterium sp.]|nr:sulfatase-like hydrolase/transferase [Solobacterium sp.]
MMAKRPNIIIFNPDEMRTDTMSHMGNPAAVTPFLDEFQSTEAVSFRNAYCQNPVCVPSRCSFFTGLYPHVHGHRTMAHLLRPDESSLFLELKNSGYYVWMNSRNDLYAAQYEGWVEENCSEIFYGGNTKPAPGPVDPGIRGDMDGKQFYSHFGGQLKLDENGKNYNRDDEAVDALIERIRNPKSDAPLCAFVGLMYPHTPYQVEEPYFSAIDRTKLPKRVRPEECTGKPLMEERLRHFQHMQDYTEEEWDELRAVYLGMCMKVDEQFRRVCDALKEAGEYDNSAIFFLSDHGDFDGDYGIPEKAQNCFEDCLTKVPFLIKPPKGEAIDPGISDSLVELVDFYATAMDYAGVTPDHTQFGKSLRPVLADRNAKIRDYVFSEGGRMPGEEHCDESHINGPQGSPKNNVYWPRQTAQREDDAHIKGTMIFDGRYKYIMRQDDTDEFYDLEKDPGERTNRIDEAEYTGDIRRLERELLRWYQGTCDIVPLDFDKRFNAEMLWSMMKGNCRNKEEEAVVREAIMSGKPMVMVTEMLRRYREGK